MTETKKRIVALFVFLFLISPVTKAQRIQPAGSFKGRMSTGWDYYSKGGSLLPQLSTWSTTLTAQYQWLRPNEDQPLYCLYVDAYERNAFASSDPPRNAHKYVVRQLYFEYERRVKVGKVIPLNQVVDAHPINGAALEDVDVAGISVSAFGGTINDFYNESQLLGAGYNYGVSALWKQPAYYVGIGFSGESINQQESTRLYLSTFHRPLQKLQVFNRLAYSLDGSRLLYSISKAVFKPHRFLTMTTSYDFHDRTTTYLAPTDTVHDPNRYFYTEVEHTVTYTVWARLMRLHGIGHLDFSTTVRKRFGDDDLNYVSVETIYRNEFLTSFDLGMNGGLTQNDWLTLGTVGAFAEKGILDDRLTVGVHGSTYFFRWTDRQRGSRHTAMTINLDFFLSRAVSGTFSIGEEFGNYDDPRGIVFLRINYVLR